MSFIRFTPHMPADVRATRGIANGAPRIAQLADPAALSSRHAALLAGAAAVMLLTQFGCAVPSYHGQGFLQRQVEPTTSRGYWLYLPKDYMAADAAARKARLWPTVVTFHGMKPFDNSVWQAEEWAVEADRYGFIVIAPELEAPDLMAEFPLRTIHPAFRGDEVATIAIMDYVFRTTDADRTHVLATGWSSGGYMAHYMVNLHPDRFTCLSPRQANFSSSVMNEALSPRSRNHPILIINTQNDMDICKRESREAVAWYKRLNYRNVAWVYIKDLGHERTPDLSADFFARCVPVEPATPPDILVARQAIDGNPEGLAFLSGRVPAARTAAAADGGNPGAPATPRSEAISIRVTSAIGIEPLNLGFNAVCPSEWYQSASFQWTLNGQPIGVGASGQTTVTQAGEHTLGLLVITRDNQEHRAVRTIRVIHQFRSAGLSTDRTTP